MDLGSAEAATFLKPAVATSGLGATIPAPSGSVSAKSSREEKSKVRRFFTGSCAGKETARMTKRRVCVHH